MRGRYGLAIAVGLILIYTGWWWLTAHSLNQRLERWVAAEQAEGATIAPAALSVGGYPLAFSISADNVAAGWPDGFGFKAQSATLRARPWALRHVLLVARGGFAVTLPAGSVRPTLTIAGETLRGVAVFADGDIPSGLDLNADTVSASRTAVTGDAGREVSAATLKFSLIRADPPPKADTDAAYTLSLKLLDVSAAAIEGNPLGATIAETDIAAKLLGTPPATPDAAGLGAWRDAGGTVEIDAIGLRWGTLGVTATGTLALDAHMQPEAAFSTQLSGWEPAIDALTAAGWVKPSGASLAKLALGIASHPGPDGKPVVDTPLSIQNRRLSLGPIKLGEVPALKLD